MTALMTNTENATRTAERDSLNRATVSDRPITMNNPENTLPYRRERSAQTTNAARDAKMIQYTCCFWSMPNHVSSP